MASIQQDKIIEHAILSTQKLRASVAKSFHHLQDGTSNTQDDEDKIKAFVSKLQEDLSTVNDNYTELERFTASMVPLGDKAQLHNSGFLSLDPITDKTPIYTQALQSYKWAAKLHTHSTQALSVLQHSWSLKRSSGVTSLSSKKTETTINYMVNKVIVQLDRQYPDISITKVQPFSNVYQVSLGRTLQVILVLRSLLIERVIVRAHHEHILKDDGTLDIWAKSRYEVFQKITDHATSAMLHYDLHSLPELSIMSFMKWLHSYINFFSTPCRRCGKHLKDNLPPTWRDFLSLDPYHETCRL
ncbi:mediator of RNA polymerase II transcription subunit 27-like [Amphiura filiformis]|uniref:mediator of RNA polymerase II transcription subunit 27-like n=1 Tax=Amphiura filiformis TaxID=82378 RepID=UPI003B213B4E